MCVIPFEICALLGYYYAASSGNSLQTFRDNLSVISPYTLEDVTDRLFRNVWRGLPLLAA